MADKPPLLDLPRVEAFLDTHTLGSGPVTAARIGDGGGSNFTFLLERGGDRFVLRRPPRPPLPPSAHDMVREAGLQNAIRAAGFGRLAEIVAVCDDDGRDRRPVLRDAFPRRGRDHRASCRPGSRPRRRGARLGLDLVDTLVEIHAADVSRPELAAFARPGSYLERQVRRFTQLWGINKTRELPDVEQVGASGSPRVSPSRSRRRSCTATTDSGT